jgi:ribonuclease-3
VTATAPDEAERDALESVLGYHFKDRSLLERALVHGSLGAEQSVATNETLEFLGDAVIGLAVSQLLMEAHPHYDEGSLTRARAASVSKTSLAELAESLGLGGYIRFGRGERAAGGSRKPRILSSCYEALIGAVFLDAGYETAREVVTRHMGKRLERGAVEIDFKTRLQELTQSRMRVAPAYRTVEVTGPDHARRYRAVVEVGGDQLGSGEGPSRKSAEQAAASEALARLGGD